MPLEIFSSLALNGERQRVENARVNGDPRGADLGG